jgi:phosphoserine phosphatase
VNRINQWMQARSQNWNSFDAVTFYSDSINDLPLLELADQPVAVNPDEKLLAVAKSRNWPVLELFQ